MARQKSERAAYGPDARGARGEAGRAIGCGGGVGGGDDEAGEDGGADAPGGDVGEERARAGPVEPAVEARGRGRHADCRLDWRREANRCTTAAGEEHHSTAGGEREGGKEMACARLRLAIL